MRTNNKSAKSRAKLPDRRVMGRFPEGLLRRVDAIAELRGLTRSSYIRTLLIEAVDKDASRRAGKPTRDAP